MGSVGDEMKPLINDEGKMWVFLAFMLVFGIWFLIAVSIGLSESVASEERICQENGMWVSTIALERGCVDHKGEIHQFTKVPDGD